VLTREAHCAAKHCQQATDGAIRHGGLLIESIGVRRRDMIRQLTQGRKPGNIHRQRAVLKRYHDLGKETHAVQSNGFGSYGHRSDLHAVRRIDGSAGLDFDIVAVLD
jgi:hypothetical protein